jgi:hypothetical protein
MNIEKDKKELVVSIQALNDADNMFEEFGHVARRLLDDLYEGMLTEEIRKNFC